jgi:hypothetical protein
VNQILHTHFRQQWRQTWLRRKLPGEALPILPKEAGAVSSSSKSEKPRQVCFVSLLFEDIGIDLVPRVSQSSIVLGAYAHEIGEKYSGQS